MEQTAVATNDMSHLTPVRFGLTGLGGYAAYVCDRILEEHGSATPTAGLLAICDPELERHARRSQELQARGVHVVRTFEELLNFDIEAVWLPLPIDLHRPYTEMALNAGKAVFCEKPAAGCVDDVDAMIAARDRARLPVAIGFQDMYQPSLVALKRRIITGEFGAPVAATVIGCWPRSERYYGRNDWAGKFRRDGRWIMDSPASNALAHFMHLTLFLLGPAEGQSAPPVEVAAELYRANRIENYDTCSLRYTLASGARVFVAYTHACNVNIDPIITVETDRGARIRYIAGRQIEILVGEKLEVLPLSSHPHRHMLAGFQQWVRNGIESSPGSSLEAARVHVVSVNAASEAAPVVDVPPSFIDVGPSSDNALLRSIRNIVPAMQLAVSKKCLLGELAVAPWTAPAGVLPINGYSHFAGPHKPVAKPTTPGGPSGTSAAGRPSVSVTVQAQSSATAAASLPKSVVPKPA
ncbi:MAG TPA: Gfo/Idh/MocA family oxidoreductase [Tepidisphaeraceae bacterium]|nr:Gfo/Idh/MocA family oxidoreductase [Tepidisphaeraceae bacterium]